MIKYPVKELNFDSLTRYFFFCITCNKLLNMMGQLPTNTTYVVNEIKIQELAYAQAVIALYRNRY